MTDSNEFNGIDFHHAQGLTAFLAAAPVLSADEQHSVLDAAIGLLGGHYAHLPHKRVSQGVDPVARLRALQARLDAAGAAAPLGVPDFHEAMCAVFAELHDLHTLYLLPAYYAAMVAFLPFQVGLLMEPGAEARVLVTHVMPGFTHAPFGRGVRIVTWSGMPVARVLQRLSAHSGGANPAAACARAVALLTQRPMLRMPPPAEAWVDVGYVAQAGDAVRTMRMAWRVAPLATGATHAHSPRGLLHMALDCEGDALHRHHRGMFAPQGFGPGHPLDTAIATSSEELAAWSGGVDGVRFGYLRIRSFKQPEEDFLAEMRRLLPSMPEAGLIIDIRDNPGGLVAAAERMLQYLTDAVVQPVRAQFLASAANLALCEAQMSGVAVDLSDWVGSLRLAVASGAAWSDAFALTPADACRDIGRLYRGRVLLITSGRSYSAADIFAAGFRDNGIGLIVGVDADTGAGGANMWTSGQVAALMGAPAPSLPQGVQFRVAIRRIVRVAGDQILEESGIIPDRQYVSTAADLLEKDPDLLRGCARLLLDR